MLFLADWPDGGSGTIYRAVDEQTARHALAELRQRDRHFDVPAERVQRDGLFLTEVIKNGAKTDAGAVLKRCVE
jgi:hypothetical protein